MTALKAATAQQHRLLEAVVDPSRADLTRDSYVALLRKFHGFLHPWERLIASCLSGRLLEIFNSRRKLPWLAADLQALDPPGRTPPPDCPNLPPIQRTAAAIGSWYVIEGSTLGGQLITRRLLGRWGLSPEHGLRYFSGYGNATPTNWTDFRNRAETSVDAAEYQDATAAACDTFDSLRNWFDA